jgi:hypothetical protein
VRGGGPEPASVACTQGDITCEFLERSSLEFVNFFT